MRLLIVFAALLLSVIFLQLGSGALGPLDALSGLQEGFSKGEVGLLGSAHFVGFFIGCWLAPRMMGSVGHARAFSAFAACGAIGALAHPLIVSPYAWMFFRIMSGFSIAGAYTIVEAWLNAKTNNETRGRVFGAYRFIDLGASFLAQLMIGFLEPASYVSYNILAIVFCASLVPMTLTTTKAPETPNAPRLRPIKAIKLSPLGAMGVFVAGLTTPAFRMTGPIYGQEVGLFPSQIGYFLAAFVVGGALAQIPIGWLADKIDRRRVLIIVSVAALLVSITTLGLQASQPHLIYLTAFAFGLTTFPVFSISAAHANDFAPPDFVVELSASLMFIYACGAITAPYITAELIAAYGPSAMFLFIGGAHIVLIVFGFLRMRVRPAAAVTSYEYVPRTSFIVGKLRQNKELDDDHQKKHGE